MNPITVCNEHKLKVKVKPIVDQKVVWILGFKGMTWGYLRGNS